MMVRAVGRTSYSSVTGNNARLSRPGFPPPGWPRPRPRRPCGPGRRARRTAGTPAARRPARPCRRRRAPRPRRSSRRRRAHRAATPASTLPSVGPIEYESISMPASRPRRWSGMVWFQMVEPEDARDHVGGAGQHQADQRQPQRVATGRSRRSPTPQPPAASTTARPCRCTRPVQPRRQRGQQRAGRRAPRRAARARPAAQPVGHEREQRLRHAEEHRVDVDQVGAEQLRAAAGVPQPGRRRERSDGRSGAGGGGTARISARQARLTRERGQVDGVHPGQADAGEQDARAAPGRPATRCSCAASSARWRPLSASGGTSRGMIASSAGRCSPSTAVVSAATTNSSHSCGRPSSALTSSTPVSTGERHLADDDQPPPVEVVGQRAADERHDQQRDRARRPRAGRPAGDRGQHVDLVRDRDVRDERPERRHARPGEDEA